jgi:hypothetical protein
MVGVPRFGNLRTRLPLGLDRCRNLAPPVHAQGLLAVRGAGVDVYRLRERGLCDIFSIQITRITIPGLD